ncbi:MAG: hypothetical protein IJ677_08920 [Alphaproteobacteria bacterium]|nr:hypothetical protein [Alphaproteobacteria bacterium]
MSGEKYEADVFGDMFGDKTAHIKYTDADEKKLDISFHWHTKQRGSGGYFSMDENYVEIHVSEPGLLKNKEIYSDNRKVGEDTWIAHSVGGGGKAEGIQTFDQFLKNTEVFNHIEDEKLRSILYKAQNSASDALHVYYENYETNKNRLSEVRKKLAKKVDNFTHNTGIDKAAEKVGIDVRLENKRLNKTLRDGEKQISKFIDRMLKTKVKD